jgi:eukaryotic-like serine/threonine-protein kinase
MTSTGQVKVLDFGIARLAEPIGDVAATVTGAALGTPAYMPPEQARGRWTQVDPRTDLWALGATLHALVLGDRPRRAETVQEEMLLAMTAPLPSLRVTLPTAPAPLIDLIERATAFEMDARFPNATSMQAALRQVITQVNLPPSPPVQFGGAPKVDGPNPATGSGGSGPKIDTAPMVFGRDPSTLHATESSQAASPPPKSRIVMAASVFVITLVAATAIGAKVLLSTSAPSSAAGTVTSPAPSAGGATPPPSADAAGIEFPSSSAAPASSSTASAAATAAPPTTSTPPSEPSPTPSATSHHHHTRPTPGASAAPAAPDNPFDQRF